MSGSWLAPGRRVLNAGARRATPVKPHTGQMSRDNVHLMSRRDGRNDWASYWRSPDGLLEAMHAHFRGHVYHRHSHETYSFGLTEAGAQAFTCRGAGHVSRAGMVMAFNPDDPHDGHAAAAGGFTYRMIHVGPALLTDALADLTGRPEGQPLFAAPVLGDPALAAAVHRLHTTLTGPASALERAERLTAVVGTAARHAATPRRPGADRRTARDRAAAAERVRAFLHDSYATGATPGEVAKAAGCSRFAAYRAFRDRYGLAPSDYERQLRLWAARRALASGAAVADVAAVVGFADQAHLTRWFRRCYGITPGAYRTASGRE
jgi:AraC-like DNA-binding protein